MKILYINSFYPPDVGGGAELSLQLIVEGMRSIGHNVVVVATGSHSGLVSYMINDIKVYKVGIKNTYWPLTQTRPGKLRRLLWHARDIYNTEMADYVRLILNEEQPDIISCHNLSGWSIAVWKVLANYKKPILQVLHDLYLLCPNSNMFKGGQSCAGQCALCRSMRLIHRRASRSVDAVVGISQYILSKFNEANYFTNAEKYVIYNFRTDPSVELAGFRKPGSPLRVGYVGTLISSKGIEWLIRSFLKIEDPHITLKIAGKGQIGYEAHLKELAADDSRITFLGFVNPNAFYRTIDVLVVPSLWEEPLGMVAIEACAHHIPVITTGRGGLKEIIKDELNGKIVQPGQDAILGQVILKLKTDVSLYNNLQANALKSVTHFLQYERLISEYDKVYRQLTSR